MLPEKIQNILINNDLVEYIQLFEQHRLDRIETLQDMTDNDYEKIGILAVGDRKKLVKLFSVKDTNNDETNVNVPVNVVVQETKSESGGHGLSAVLGILGGIIGVVIVILIILASIPRTESL